MKGKLDMTSLLETADTDMDFTDGNKSRVWENAVRGRRKTLKPKLKWLIPVAAACTVLFTLGAIPQSRAAMVGLFNKIFSALDYMNMDKGSRPENSTLDNLLVSDVPVKVTVSQEPGCADSDWVKNIAVHIDELLYDGQEIYIKYTVTAKGVDRFPDPVPATKDNPTVQYRSFEPTSVEFAGYKPPQESWGNSEDLHKIGDGVWQDVTSYGYKDMKLSGVVDATLIIVLRNNTDQWDGNGGSSGTGAQAGTIRAEFKFNADAGGHHRKDVTVTKGKHALSGDVIATYVGHDPQTNKAYVENKMLSMDGCAVEVMSITRSPTETTMALRFTPSEALKDAPLLGNDGYVGNINIELMDGDRVVGRMNDWGPDELGYVDINMSAPLLPDDIIKLTVHMTFCYATEFEQYQMELDKPVPYNETPDYDYSFSPAYGEIHGGTFDIDLSK